MNKPAYFKQFGADDYNIFAVKDKSYVMSRFTDDPEGVYYMLFEHVEGQTGVSYYMLDNIPETVLDDVSETVLDDVSDGGYTDREFASRLVGQDRFVHNINVRRLLRHSHLDA